MLSKSFPVFWVWRAIISEALARLMFDWTSVAEYAGVRDPGRHSYATGPTAEDWGRKWYHPNSGRSSVQWAFGLFHCPSISAVPSFPLSYCPSFLLSSFSIALFFLMPICSIACHFKKKYCLTVLLPHLFYCSLSSIPSFLLFALFCCPYFLLPLFFALILPSWLTGG